MVFHVLLAQLAPRAAGRSYRSRFGLGIAAATLIICGVGCRALGPKGLEDDPENLAMLESLLSQNDETVCSARTESILNGLQQRYPKDFLMRSALLTMYRRCERWDDYATVIEAVPENDRNDMDRLELARVYLRHQKRFADAERIARRLAERHPDNFDVISIAASAVYYQNRLQEAGELIDTLWPEIVATRNTDIMTMRADAYLEAGNAERARSILDEVLIMNPQHGFGLSTMVRALSVLGDHERASALQERADRMSAEADAQVTINTRLSALIADMHEAWQAGRHAEAERLALDILTDLPIERHPEIYRSLARIYEAQGRPDDARNAFSQAATLEESGNAEP